MVAVVHLVIVLVEMVNYYTIESSGGDVAIRSAIDVVMVNQCDRLLLAVVGSC